MKRLALFIALLLTACAGPTNGAGGSARPNTPAPSNTPSPTPSATLAATATPDPTPTPTVTPAPTATEMQTVFSAEQVAAATDAELLTAANVAVPEYVEGRPDFANIALETSSVYRGGVGKEYQYDYVLLNDAKTNLLAGVYNLATGEVLHAYGGVYSREVSGTVYSKTVLFITDQSFVDREPGKTQYFGLQGDDLNKSLQQAIEFTVARRAIQFTWSDQQGVEIFANYLKDSFPGTPWRTNQSSVDAEVSRLSDPDKLALLGESIDFYMITNSNSSLTIYKDGVGKFWGEAGVGYNGGKLSKEDKTSNSDAEICKFPPGRPNIPMYNMYGGLPPGGLAAACTLDQGSELGRLDRQGSGLKAGILLNLLEIYYGQEGSNLWALRDLTPPVGIITN